MVGSGRVGLSRVGSRRAGSTLQMDSGHKNKKIRSYQKFVSPFKGFYAMSTILIHTCRKKTSPALREDAYGALARIKQRELISSEWR